MTVSEIHDNLLKTLSKVAEQHAAVLRNPLPGHEPFLIDMELRRQAAQVSVAKLMCHAAGIDEDFIRVLVDLHYAGLESRQTVEK